MTKAKLSTSSLLMGATSQELTQDQLDFVFSCCLQPGQAWKAPISIMLNIEEMISLLQHRGIKCETTEHLITTISRAICYFTATDATCTVCDEDRHLAVEAVGYWAGPAGA